VTGFASAGLHALVLAAALVLPLLARQPVPERAEGVHAFFVEPLNLAPPPPPPPPPASTSARAVVRAARPPVGSDALRAPDLVPTQVVPEQGLDLGVEGGVPGGVEGGVPGGVVGGVIGGLPEAPAPPLARRVQAGKDVRAPRKLRDMAPAYPQAARLARLQGVVVVECVIDERGRVQSAAVVKGVPLLDEAALDAVRQWVYAPSLLDGVPVEVVLTVTVTFRLR
jgi:protein TonB